MPKTFLALPGAEPLEMPETTTASGLSGTLKGAITDGVTYTLTTAGGQLVVVNGATLQWFSVWDEEQHSVADNVH